MKSWRGASDSGREIESSGGMGAVNVASGSAKESGHSSSREELAGRD
jgi:hypothetical protein